MIFKFFPSGGKKYLLFFALLVFLYSVKIVFSNSLIYYDDALLFAPLVGVNSLPDYFQKFFIDKVIYDVQPVRDLVLVLSIKFYDFIGYNIVYVLNLFLLFLSSILFSLRKSSELKGRTFLFVALFCVHPMLSGVVSWASAIKHTLSFFFLTVSWFYLDEIYYQISEKNKSNKKNKFVAIFSWVLSGFSQPINIFFPFVYFMVLILKKKTNCKERENVVIWIMFLVSFAVIALNYHYYTTWFIETTKGYGKFINNQTAGLIGLRIMSLGRALVQIFPQPYLVEYEIYSYKNMIGVSLLVFFSFYLIKCKRWSLLFYFTPFFVLLPKVTSIFWFDTYGLLPLLVCTEEIVLRCDKLITRFKKPLLFFLSIVTVLNTLKWTSMKSIYTWKNYFEPSARSLSTSFIKFNHLDDHERLQLGLEAFRYPDYDPKFKFNITNFLINNKQIGCEYLGRFDKILPQDSDRETIRAYKLYLVDICKGRYHLLHELEKESPAFQTTLTLYQLLIARYGLYYSDNFVYELVRLKIIPRGFNVLAGTSTMRRNLMLSQNNIKTILDIKNEF